MVVACAALGSAPACTSSDDDSDIPDLPEEDTPPPDDTADTDFPADTDLGGPDDQVPLHYLYMYQDGAWNLSPGGGPYDVLTGSLTVMEFIDYERPGEDTDTDPGDPWDELEESPLICEVTYTLIGAKAEQACSGCAFAMDIEYRVASGDPAPCYDVDLPSDGDVLRFGWHETQGTIYHDFAGVGAWFPWYKAEKTGDSLSFAWFARMGVSIEEEDDQ